MKRYWLFLLLMIGLAVWLWPAAAGPAQAREPHAVELAYFIGAGVTQGVELEWRASTEYGTAAYRMKRATNANGPFDYITVLFEGQVISVVPTYGFPETGGTYIVLDVTATTGVTYWYTLIEVLENGGEAALETISVVAGYNPSPTPTSQVIGGGNTTPATATPTATSPAAATPTATPFTPIPTNTSVPTGPAATATPALTNTPIPTAVPATVSPANTGNNGSGNGDNSGSISTPIPTTSTTSTNGAGQPIAQVTAAASSAYPGTTDETRGLAPDSPPATTEGYPGEQPAPPIGEATLTPYPVNGVEFEGTPPTAYQGNEGTVTDFGQDTGSSTGDTLPPPAGTTTTTNNTPGRIVLWVGFVAGLFIFAAGVFGTILLFTRKQNGPQ